MTRVGKWTLIVGYTSSLGLVLLQRHDDERGFRTRRIRMPPHLTPVHPVIVADPEKRRFHVVATGQQPGQPGRLIYAAAPVEPERQ